jgi:hypothetical protein
VINREKRKDCHVVTVKYLHATQTIGSVQGTAILEIRLENSSPWPQSVRELYRPSDHSLSAKLVPTFADRGCHVVSVTDPYGRTIDVLDRSRYFFFHAALQLYSRGRVDPVQDLLLLRKSGRAENRTRTSRCAARNTDH